MNKVSKISHIPFWLIVLVTFSGTMAMHIFIPALPLTGKAFGASVSNMQLTITTYVVGLAIGQILYGPLSDAFGRRPILLIGLSIYFSASVIALLATNLEWLVTARFMQALGGAAGITLGRAIVRDTALPGRLTKDISLLNLLMLLGPGVAPLVGSYLAEHFGWRSIYIFIVILGGIMLISTTTLLSETNSHRRPFKLNFIARDYKQLISTPSFSTMMLGGACSSITLYPYLATVPYIVHNQLNLQIKDVGWFSASLIIGASLGSVLTRRFAGYWSSAHFLFLGSGLQFLMAATLLIVHLLGWLTPINLLVITVTMTFGAGIASPAAISCALSALPRLTGSASGLYGFGQMSMGALATFLVGFGDDPLVSCAITQISLTITAISCFRLAPLKNLKMN